MPDCHSAALSPWQAGGVIFNSTIRPSTLGRALCHRTTDFSNACGKRPRREFAGRYVTALCALPAIGEGRVKPPVPVPAESELEQIAFAVPPMVGAEYLTTALLVDLWHRIDAAVDVELAVANLTVQEFL